MNPQSVAANVRTDAIEPVVRPHRRDGLRDLLAVCADVLDRRGTGGAGDAGERLDTDPALGDRPGDHVVPRLAGGDRDHRTAAGIGVDRDAAGQHPDDGAVESLVGDDEVAATGDQQHRIGGLVGDPYGVDQLGLGRGFENCLGRTTQTQRRQVGQVHGARR